MTDIPEAKPVSSIEFVFPVDCITSEPNRIY